MQTHVHRGAGVARRQLLKLGVATGASLIAGPALSQEVLPAGPVRIFVGFPAGGSTDTLSRMLGDRLRALLNRTVVVVNQPGATGVISINQLKRAPADGSTVGLVAMASGILVPKLTGNMRLDLLADLEPVANMASYALSFSIGNQLGISDWRAFVQWARAHPNDLFYGHGGVGSVGQLLGALIAGAMGQRFQDVPFKGGPDVAQAVAGGQVLSGVAGTAEVGAVYAAGRLKMLAVSSKGRAPGLPEVPSFFELGLTSVVAEPWFGIFAPPGTPAPAVAAWNRAINTALTDPALRTSLGGQGYLIKGGTPSEFRDTVAADVVQWHKAVDTLGLKPKE